MKRSEAIEKLTDDLMCYYDNEEEAEFYAKSFLSSVESLGMLPPVKFGAHLDLDMQYSDEVTKVYCIWEDEDET